jgi:microcystin-dependent protein
MAQPYVGEIRIFAGNFAPAGWMFCDGQLLPISENETLFQLIGTTYGGDGQSTFALPDLRSRVPIHMGTGPDGVSYQLSDMAGVEEVTLTVQQIPNHNHALLGSGDAAATQDPANAVPSTAQAQSYYNIFENPANMAATAIAPAGGSQPHTNLQPYLCVNFIISLFGLFPQQN